MENTDAYIVQRFEYCEQKAKSLKLSITVCGSGFDLTGKKKYFGRFVSIAEMYAFLCGYEYSC